MNEEPLVSAIIIFLNAERFLEEAIVSVFAQSYQHWELLLVDDGSSDNSTGIAYWYAAQFPDRVRYLVHDGHRNQGKSASRNLGIANARGKYIAFLDADDVWLPQKLEEQVAIMTQQPEAAMVYGLSTWWYSWTGRPEDRNRDYVYELGIPPNSLVEPPALFSHFFVHQQAAIPGPSSILVRREVFDTVGGFDEGFHGANDVYEDQAFYAKVALNKPIFAAEKSWDRYRQHPHSSSAVVEQSGQVYATRRFFLRWLMKYLAEHELKDSKFWRALRRQLWIYRYPVLLQLGWFRRLS